MNILLVDDEQDILDIYSQHIRNYIPEARIFTATNGELAIASIVINEIDLMITDLSMPVLDGFKLIDIVNEKFPKIRIFISTACDISQDMIENFCGKVIGFIFKPAYVGTLVNGISQASKLFNIK